ncbi:hypothetical protein PISMIDRAFT_689719, partial [Pisolithus microcarpus 441]
MQVAHRLVVDRAHTIHRPNTDVDIQTICEGGIQVGGMAGKGMVYMSVIHVSRFDPRP